MKRATLLGLLLVCLLAALCRGFNLPAEDDLVFDDAPSAAEQETVQRPAAAASIANAARKERKHKKWQFVKYRGVPQLFAAVGHVFKYDVSQAFSGRVDFYEVTSIGSKSLDSWLYWDEAAAVLYGVPSRSDMGRTWVSVKAYGKYGDVAEGSFYFHVVRENFEHYGEWNTRCHEDQDRTMLALLVDGQYDKLNASVKVTALENLAGFLGFNVSWVTIHPHNEKLNSPEDPRVMRLGNVHKPRDAENSSKVQWQVGCDGQIWSGMINATLDIPEQAMDGTLSEVLELMVYQWQLRTEPPYFARNRRDARGGGSTGSGDGLLPDEDDEEYDDDDEEYEEYEDNIEGVTASPKAVQVHPGSLPDEHPHRHHHGEDNIANIGDNINSEDDFIWGPGDLNNKVFNSTPASTSTTSTSTIAVTLPSSTTTTTTTTTPSTTSTTTTTTTTTTEQPTTPSTSTTTESTTVSSTASPTEEESSPTSENATSTSQATFSGTNETSTTESSTATYTNLTQVLTNSNSQSPSTNVSTDSLTVDGEDALTTARDVDNETDSELTTLTAVQTNVSAASEATTTSAGTAATSGSFAEMVPTSAEPNATSTFTVNATTDEYTEASGASKEVSTASPATSSSIGSWSDNATEKILGEPLDPYDGDIVPEYSSTTSTTSTTPSTTSTTSTTVTTTETTSTTSTTTTTTPEPTTPSTTSTTTTTTPEPTTPSTTSTTTTTPSTTTTTTTEKIDYRFHNLPPVVERRLKKIPITQGKLLSYTIPEDTFSDQEDGNTRNLRLKVYEKGAPLKPTYWLQFNEKTQEVYGLPLQEQYGTYPFEVVATDSEGLTVSDRLDISVQQHKQIRAVNHEFHVYLKIEKRSEFPTNVDWELKVMRSLAELYGDSDLSYITVRSIDIDHDQAIYSWTNDSLVRSSTCPQEDINRLLRVMVADEKSEEPSERLARVLGPEIRPKRVVYQGLEQCQQTKETQVNKFPVPRNQIDQLNATVGQLFVYRVPQDTFFDEEDGDTRSMKASLLTANRTEIPSWDWLQFDSSSQEFYGVPLKQDIGRKTYQLVVKDRDGLEATDSLVAEVHPAPVVRHVVQISMTLNMPLESFAHSAQKKREFIQKLQKLYGDKNTSAISILSITGNRETTTVTWRNLTLPTYECPHEEITRLRRVLVNDNKSFTDELNREFNSNSQQPEFAVIQITVSQMGACQDLGAGVPDIPPVDDSTSVGASHDDYLVTFVLPAVIIATMLILAGLIACILYKRRRSGKMSVSEKDDERQSFRSKGIPVIFQDELEEKPDPGNKSPIILKEEKPPLPPPEYQRAEDGADIPMLSKENSEEPYQPPPPFATNRDSNRQNRPKPTPTYRKPPPYVPP